jgi:hypothetical protein
VPIWWGVEIKNSGVGEAEIWVNRTHTYRGSRTYFKRLQQRYIPHFPPQPMPSEVSAEEESAEGSGVGPGEDGGLSSEAGNAGATVPITCINLLRCAMGKGEILLSEQFQEALRHIRKADKNRQIKVRLLS